MTERRFDIVFEKLNQESRRDPETAATVAAAAAIRPEAEEIGELRRLVSALTEPPPRFYTIS